MSEDPRCCGSGMCIIDGQGRCWCGQEWDGEKMCARPSSPSAPSAAIEADARVSPTPSDAALPGSIGFEPPASAEDDTRPAASAARRLLVLAALALPLAAILPRPVQAQAGSRAQGRDFTASEVKALQATVQGQLAAFAAGDAARAYGFATAAIQKQFGDAAQFLAMVQTAYPMIIKPRNVAFRLPERVAAAVIQPVQLRDVEGRAWLATYQLEAQPGGGWRIAGCVVTADEQRLST